MDRIGAVLVDTYRIERLIAEGGMGAVYEASHLRIPKKFAIKFLKVSLLDNSVALLRFRREAEVVATLDHPHIVSLFDYNLTSDGVPYTVLEYLEGEHLGDRVARGRMPIADVLRVTEAVSGALTVAHDKGVIHRDLKPENVILGLKGAIKVVDFGIAKLRGGQELTAFNSILGTVTYMAPEQLMAGQIDARADQFALAAMVYEMLSGDMPFGSEGSIPEIAERVLRRDPDKIGGYSDAVNDVVRRGMAKEAAQRYPNVGAFYEALAASTRALLEETESPTATPSALTAMPEMPAQATLIAPPAAPPAAASEAELPELPADATAISMGPSDTQANPIVPARPPTGESEAPELPTDQTRITRSPNEGHEQPVVQGRPEIPTGRMSIIRQSFANRVGRAGGIAIGVFVGALLVVAVTLLWR